GGDALQYFPDAQYAMAVLADEIFLHFDWVGQEAWNRYKLEPRMFKTNYAGMELFKRIDKLVREPKPKVGARHLARVYLLVLPSGFKGKFREPRLKSPIAEYRRRRHEFIQ